MAAENFAAALKRGSKRHSVKELQALLNQAGASPTLRADGKVGTHTRTALRQAITPPKPARSWTHKL